MNDLVRELDVARRAARLAAEAIFVRYGSDAEVRYKTPTEPVTDADMVADEILHRELIGAFPHDGWLSEESVDDPSRLGRSRVWVVDPLDGTREFIARRPEFNVSVGLSIDGVPTLGVIVNPVTGESFFATLGGGAFVEDRSGATRKLQTNSVSELAHGRFAVSRSEHRRGMLAPFERLLALRAIGGMAEKLVMVASGVVDGTFTLQRRCEWDVAAGAVVLTEAGGRFTRLDGSRLVLNRASPALEGVVASNGPLHDRLLAILRSSA